MAIEIRQLSIKSNVVQRAASAAAPSASAGTSSAHGCGATQLDETSRIELLAECRAMVLELMSRARER